MKQIHLDVTVIGRVQGVGFRMGAAHKASVLGLKGWVMNTEDGKVTIAIEGEEEVVDKFVQWSHEGTMLSQVNQVITKSGKFENYQEFRIRK